MLSKRILIGVIIAVAGSGLFSVLVHHGLVDIFGKHVSSVNYGRLTEHSYLVDQKARKRIRWGTLIISLVIAVLIFACAWCTILTPENFKDFFPGQ